MFVRLIFVLYCNKGEMIPLEDEGIMVFAIIVLEIYSILLKMKNHPIKNHPKRYASMLIKELIILKKYLLNSKVKKPHKYLLRLLKILNYKSKKRELTYLLSPMAKLKKYSKNLGTINIMSIYRLLKIN